MKNNLSEEASLPTSTTNDPHNVPGNNHNRVPRWLIPVGIIVCVCLVIAGAWWAISAYQSEQEKQALVAARQECVKTSKQAVKQADAWKPLDKQVTTMVASLKPLAGEKNQRATGLIGKLTRLHEDSKLMVPDCPVASGKHNTMLHDYQTVNQALHKLVKKLTQQSKKARELMRDGQKVLDEHALDQARKLAEQAKGNIQDQATLDQLNKAVERKDVKSLTTLSQQVQESMQAKAQADRQAQEAARRSQAQAQRAYPKYQPYQGAYGQGTTPSQPWHWVDEKGNPAPMPGGNQPVDMPKSDSIEDIQAWLTAHGHPPVKRDDICNPGQPCPIG